MSTNLDDSSNLRLLADQVRERRLGPRETYSAIHDLGRAHFIEAAPAIQPYLRHEDPQLRYIALEVLAGHFALREHWQTAKDFLEHDEDALCRMMGASMLGQLRRNTKDRITLATLARVVHNKEDDASVRAAAYRAMRSVSNFDPKEQFRLSGKVIDEIAVDWAWVDRCI